jgi:hypothetical protein
MRLSDGNEESLASTVSRARTLSNNWMQFDDFLNLRQPLLHGEVQTSSSVFRKKKEYLVLTDTHLLRFKNYHKAAEAFPMYVCPSSCFGGTEHATCSNRERGTQPSQSEP